MGGVLWDDTVDDQWAGMPPMGRPILHPTGCPMGRSSLHGATHEKFHRQSNMTTFTHKSSNGSSQEISYDMSHVLRGNPLEDSRDVLF